METLQLPDRLSAYIALTRLDRPIGIFLLMWPMLWALWFAAEGVPDLKILLIFVLGTILTRSAGCAINDYADREIDGHVARTSNRPLATGALTPQQALATFAVLMLAAFVLVLFTNRLTVLMSIIAVVLAAVYPFTKRYTDLPQIVLGLAFSWAIPMAYTAQTGGVNTITWIVFAASVLWALAYDTLYAMADREDDIIVGVRSSAILFGRHDRLVVALTQAAVVALVVTAGLLMNRGALFLIGVLIASGFIIYQLHITRTRDPALCIRAFLNNNYVGMIMFAGIVLDYAVE